MTLRSYERIRSNYDSDKDYGQPEWGDIIRFLELALVIISIIIIIAIAL